MSIGFDCVLLCVGCVLLCFVAFRVCGAGRSRNLCLDTQLCFCVSACVLVVFRSCLESCFATACVRMTLRLPPATTAAPPSQPRALAGSPSPPRRQWPSNVQKGVLLKGILLRSGGGYRKV